MIDKNKCKKLYRALKADMGDLESVEFREHWFYRAEELRTAGCWWHYEVITRKARDYILGRGDYVPEWLRGGKNPEIGITH